MSDEVYMRVAIEKAKEGMKYGQPPIGACIVRQGKVISSAHNKVFMNMDVTAHAEVQAIREACDKLDTINLSDCTLYSTSEPCSMCFMASHWAQIGRIVFGAQANDATILRFEEIQHDSRQNQSFLGSNIELVENVLREEILETLKPISRSDDRREIEKAMQEQKEQQKIKH